MMRAFRALVAVLLLGAAPLAQADTAWSGENYDLHPGDFNGDGLSDLLYVARDARHLNGIALGDAAGFDTALQSWGNAYLGIPWSDGTYRILVADFNGDGRDDLFLQRNTPAITTCCSPRRAGSERSARACPTMRRTWTGRARPTAW
jgi:hypothetical protein